MPVWLATKRYPPITAGCERDCVAFGTPNAHLSLRFATFAAVIPPALDWKRVLCTSGPQPLQTEAAFFESPTNPEVQLPRSGMSAMATGLSDRPATRSATALRSAGESGWPWMRMLPSFNEARIASGPSVASASRGGALFSGVGCSWQTAQCCANTVSPSGVCACARQANAIETLNDATANARLLSIDPPASRGVGGATRRGACAIARRIAGAIGPAHVRGPDG